MPESPVQRGKNYRRVRSVLGRVRERYIFALILSDKKKGEKRKNLTLVRNYTPVHASLLIKANLINRES